VGPGLSMVPFQSSLAHIGREVLKSIFILGSLVLIVLAGFLVPFQEFRESLSWVFRMSRNAGYWLENFPDFRLAPFK